MKNQRVYLLLVVALLVSLTVQLSFAETSLIYSHEHEERIGTRAYAACPYGDGIHNMERRGWARVNVNGVMQWFGGGTYQCEKCHEAILAESVYENGQFQRYVIYNPGYELSAFGTVLEAKSSWIDYNSDVSDDFSVSDGYRFKGYD